jgi:hypothetical protein
MPKIWRGREEGMVTKAMRERGRKRDRNSTWPWQIALLDKLGIIPLIFLGIKF